MKPREMGSVTAGFEIVDPKPAKVHVAPSGLRSDLKPNDVGLLPPRDYNATRQ